MCLLSQKDLSVSSAKMTAVWSWANCSLSLNFAFLPRLLCALNETNNMKSHSQVPSPSTVPGTESALNKDSYYSSLLSSLLMCCFLLNLWTCPAVSFPAAHVHACAFPQLHYILKLPTCPSRTKKKNLLGVIQVLTSHSFLTTLQPEFYFHSSSEFAPEMAYSIAQVNILSLVFFF